MRPSVTLGAAEGDHRMYAPAHRLPRDNFFRSVVVPYGSFIIAGLVLAAAAAGLLVMLLSGTARGATTAVTHAVRTAHVTLRSAVTAASHSAPPGHVVTSGDTLSGISQGVYGSAACWPGIYRASAAVIGGNPDLIYPGQRLTVPAVCDTTAPAAYTAPASSDGLTGSPVLTSRTGKRHRDVHVTPVTVSAGVYDPQEAVLTRDQVATLWEAAGGPAWADNAAVSVAFCESSWNRYAQNPSSPAAGIWQIWGAVVNPGGNLYDAWDNALNAVAKFKASGDTWAQWSCQP